MTQRMMHVLKISALLLLICSAGPAASQNFYVLGGTVHTANGEVVEHAAVIVENGVIAGIADARLIKIDPSFGTIIQADGKHIYPGLVAAYTTLGLNEIDYMRPTRDFTETGEFNPNIRSVIAYNTDSWLIPTVRSNGVLFCQAAPEGGLISGASSVLKLEAWNWEDAVVREGDGIHLWWPAKYTDTGWWADPGPIEETGDYSEKVKRIEDFLRRAKAYLAERPAESNLILEAMEGVFQGTQNLYVHVQGAGEMVTAIHLMEELGIPKMVIVGGEGAASILGLLREKDIPVMLSAIHKLPPRGHSDVNHWYRLPAILHQAGVRFSITYGDMRASFNGSWENRSLPFLAGTAAAYGLDRETALAAISKFPAEIMGLDYSGTIEEGEQATFIISEGDLLDMRTSIVTHAWIKGVPVDLNDRHKELYAKFRGKYVEEGMIVE